LHIPFCKQACTYCNFHFTTSLRYKDAFVKALGKEAKAEKGYLNGANRKHDIFWWRHPKSPCHRDLKYILQVLHNTFPVAGDAEISMEANPDDVSVGNVRAGKALVLIVSALESNLF
jgi:oxygen-independent coproporphyrinogen-3 oxidase